MEDLNPTCNRGSSMIKNEADLCVSQASSSVSELKMGSSTLCWHCFKHNRECLALRHYASTIGKKIT